MIHIEEAEIFFFIIIYLTDQVHSYLFSKNCWREKTGNPFNNAENDGKKR